MNFLGPGWDLFRVLAHELFHSLLEGFDRSSHFGADLIVLLAADVFVSHHTHCQVVSETFSAYDFRYGARCAPVVLEQLFQAVFGLSVTNSITSPFERRGENVWNA